MPRTVLWVAIALLTAFLSSCSKRPAADSYGPLEKNATWILDGREDQLTRVDANTWEPDYQGRSDSGTTYAFALAFTSRGTPGDFEITLSHPGLKRPIKLQAATVTPESPGNRITLKETYAKPTWWIATTSATTGYPSEYRVAFAIPESYLPEYPATARLVIQGASTEEPGEIRITRGAVINVLVLGDSVVWGQGNLEHEKFTYLVARRVADETGAPVRMFKYASSGAVVSAGPGGDDECKEEPVYPGEVSQKAGAPEHRSARIPCQLESFRKRQGNPPIDLVVTDGCANDVQLDAAAGWILLPIVFRPLQGFAGGSLISEPVLRERIANHCDARMQLLLRDLRDLKSSAPGFWRDEARVVVSGYYSALSEASINSNLHDFVEKLSGKSIGPNLGFESDRREAVTRSQLWKSESDAALKRAVRSVSRGKPGDPKIAFAEVDFGGEHGFGGSKQAIFDLFFTGQDPLSARRVDQCKSVGRGDDRNCLNAATIHPNAEGERLYAESVFKAAQSTGALPNKRDFGPGGSEARCRLPDTPEARGGQCVENERDAAGNCLLTRFETLSRDCPRR